MNQKEIPDLVETFLSHRDDFKTLINASEKNEATFPVPITSNSHYNFYFNLCYMKIRTKTYTDEEEKK